MFNTFYSKEEISYSTHNYHPYPHKIIPHIARELIVQYSKVGDTILDPFCGSGTTLVEASLVGRNSIGIDNQPLACLISRVKTTPLDTVMLAHQTTTLLQDLHCLVNTENTLLDFINHSKITPPLIPKINTWFSKDALHSLSILKDRIAIVEDRNIKNFLLVAFSSTVKSVSHASSLHRLTLVQNSNNVSQSDVYHTFKNNVEAMVMRMKEYTPTGIVQIHTRDSRFLWGVEKVDCIITKLPKFNVDYSRCFKIYYWWLNIGDLGRLHKSFIGAFTTKETAVSNYYRDIKCVLLQLYNVLQSNAYCCILVEDSIFQGNSTRTPDMVIAFAQQAGFHLEKRIQRTIPKKVFVFATADKVEEIVVLKKLS